MFQPPRGLFCADIPSPVCRAGVWPRPQGWTLSRAVHTQLSPVCQNQGHGPVLVQVWAPEGSASTVPKQQQ